MSKKSFHRIIYYPIFNRCTIPKMKTMCLIDNSFNLGFMGTKPARYSTDRCIAMDYIVPPVITARSSRYTVLFFFPRGFRSKST